MKTVRSRVIQINNGKAVVLTSGGQFLEVDLPHAGLCVGDEYSFAAKSNGLWKQGLRLAVAAAFAFFILTQSFLTAMAEPAFYVNVDINPSLELQVSDTLNVIRAKGLNADGKQLLKQADVSGMGIAPALDRLVDAAVEMNFLAPEKDNTVWVSVLDTGKGKPVPNGPMFVEDVRNIMASRIEDHSLKGRVGTAEVDRKLWQQANETGQSANALLREQNRTDKNHSEKYSGGGDNSEKAYRFLETKQKPGKSKRPTPGVGVGQEKRVQKYLQNKNKEEASKKNQPAAYNEEKIDELPEFDGGSDETEADENELPADDTETNRQGQGSDSPPADSSGQLKDENSGGYSHSN